MLESLSKEVVTQRCSVEKMFLEISQNSQENTCPRVSFYKIGRAEACNLIKKETLVQVVPVNFAKFLRTPSPKEHLRWPLLFLILLSTFRRSGLQLY